MTNCVQISPVNSFATIRSNQGLIGCRLNDRGAEAKWPRIDDPSLETSHAQSPGTSSSQPEPPTSNMDEVGPVVAAELTTGAELSVEQENELMPRENLEAANQGRTWFLRIDRWDSTSSLVHSCSDIILSDCRSCAVYRGGGGQMDDCAISFPAWLLDDSRTCTAVSIAK
jgi:hypothetical protein